MGWKPPQQEEPLWPSVRLSNKRSPLPGRREPGRFLLQFTIRRFLCSPLFRQRFNTFPLARVRTVEKTIWVQQSIKFCLKPQPVGARIQNTTWHCGENVKTTQDHTRLNGTGSSEGNGAPKATALEQDAEYVKIRYTSYQQQRKDLCAASLEVSGRYDQWILTLSGGALALSLGFLERIAPAPIAWTTVLIALAWGMLILALLTGFAAIFYSQKATDRQIEVLDHGFRSFLNGKAGEPLPNKYRKHTDRLTRTSLAMLGLGLVFLCIFAFFNLPRGAVKAQPPAAMTIQSTTE